MTVTLTRSFRVRQLIVVCLIVDLIPSFALPFGQHALFVPRMCDFLLNIYYVGERPTTPSPMVLEYAPGRGLPWTAVAVG